MGATLAIAALVVTLLAVSFAGAPTQVQDHGGIFDGDTTPEACDPDPADVVVRGSVALFDVYWDPEAETLNNNPCPPAVVHTDHYDEDTETTTEITTRMPSNVDIGHTIIHLRHDVVRRTLVAEGHAMADEDGYLAVDPDSPLLDAYPPGEQNKQVWFLPIFASEEEEHAHQDELAFHLGFSAGLMRDADWKGDIQYDFEVIREPQVAPGDRGVIMVSENVSFTEQAIDWNTRDPDKKPISVAPGEYEHRAWAFTRPGTYVLSVQAKARPVSGLGDDTKVEGVTSKAREYTFHVGLLADLRVKVEPVSPAAR